MKMNENFCVVATARNSVSYEDNYGCSSIGHSGTSMYLMDHEREVCDVKLEENRNEKNSCKNFHSGLSDSGCDGNISDANYWSYNNNFLFPPHIYKRLFEQAIFNKKSYDSPKSEKLFSWNTEISAAYSSSDNNCIHEKYAIRKVGNQKRHLLMTGTRMTEIPDNEPGMHPVWGRVDMGKLLEEHGSNNELPRKDDDQGNHQLMSNIIYPGIAMRSASVPIRTMSPQVGHAGPPAAQGSHLLASPKPLDATKIGSNLSNGPAFGGRKYHCKICSQIFGSKADLQLHTQIHMREAKPYKCSQCSKAFANSSYLSQHTRIHLGIKPYRCEICQRKFTQLSHLQQHIRTHTGDKPYKCRHPGCQKAFSQLSNLQSHSRCHQTDKPYKCNSCYKCFSDEPSLLEHIPKHKESKHLKTHICQYCGKSYTQETYLSKHMQKHAERTDKRPPIAGLAGLGLNRNIASAMSQAPLTVAATATDHPYWPKVSPDSAASLAEAMQQQQQNQYDFAMQHAAASSAAAGDHLHHRALLEHHRSLNGTTEDGEDLVIANRQGAANLATSGSSGGGHITTQNPPTASTPSTAMPSGASYDTKTSTNSAFTPINSMTPHLNTLGHHHQLAQRPYIYDAISFQNKNVNQNAGASFPNQLISLHQIRNYAHQPGGPAGLMAGEHLLGIGVGVGKDKGQ